MRIKITTTKQRVENLLKTFPHLRDSDDKLIANIIYQDILKTGENPRTMSGMEVLMMIASGKTTNPESIRRCRQKLQEENPDLRGKKYEDRIDNQSKIKSELGYSTK